MHRLITIRFSHYNERARWALDHCRVPYREEAYLPLMHAGPVLWATRGRGRSDRISTPLSTPAFIPESGAPICDSGDIVAFADAHRAEGTEGLLPGRGERELERELHDGLGKYSRCFAYQHIFSNPQLFDDAARRNVSRLQANVFIAMRPAVVALIRRGLRISQAAADRARERMIAIFVEVSDRLQDERYLIADRFTAADLTFAALASPALLPTPEEGFGGGFLPRIDEVPAPWRSLAEELRDTRAGAHALRMFREHR